MNDAKTTFENFIAERFLEFYNSKFKNNFEIKERPDRQYRNSSYCDFLSQDTTDNRFILIEVGRVVTADIKRGFRVADKHTGLRKDLEKLYPNHEIIIYFFSFPDDTLCEDRIIKEIEQISHDLRNDESVEINPGILLRVRKVKSMQGKCRILPHSLKVDNQSLIGKLEKARKQFANTAIKYQCTGVCEKVILLAGMHECTSGVQYIIDLETNGFGNHRNYRDMSIYLIRLYPTKGNMSAISKICPLEYQDSFFKYKPGEFETIIQPMFPNPFVKALFPKK